MNKKLMPLIPKGHRPNRRWAVDFDYVNKLDTYEQQWLAQFAKEFYGGSIKKGDNTALHLTDELRKDCYDRNNRSNRDTYGIKNAYGWMDYDYSGDE